MRETEKIMEYARLSGASYKAPAEMAYFLTSDPTGMKYAMAGWRDVKASGFQCYLLKDRSEGGYVFAFRGTEFIREPIKDTILTDARMMLFGPPPQMYDALAFAAEMQKKYGFSEKEAVCTGHSLGGTLAAMTGYVFGFEAYAFNPYGIGKLTGSADGGAEGSGDIAAYMKKLGVTVRKNRETIHSFVNIGMFEQDFRRGAAHLRDSLAPCRQRPLSQGRAGQLVQHRREAHYRENARKPRRAAMGRRIGGAELPAEALRGVAGLRRSAARRKDGAAPARERGLEVQTRADKRPDKRPAGKDFARKGRMSGHRLCYSTY